jgi:hypothetical protein
LLSASNDPDFTDSVLAQTILNTITSKGTKVTEIKTELIDLLSRPPHGIEPEVVQLILVYLTTLGKISLRQVGGDTIDIANIAVKFRSLSQFDMIKYAAKQEELPYDFAERLLNKLGLNGAKMRQESTRIDSFREYKEKVAEITRIAKETEQQIKLLEAKTLLHLNLDQLKQAFEKTKVIDWNILNIANHASFNSLSNLNSNLSEIENALVSLHNISEAIIFYFEVVTDGIDYMKQAVDIILDNMKFISDETIVNKLNGIFEDIVVIVKDLSKFINHAERMPVAGKIQSFKNTYIKEFYFPAHEHTVGRKVNWKEFDNISKHPLYDEIKLLTELECLVVGKFSTKLIQWQKLLTWRCLDLDADKLNGTPFCTHCSFMKVEGREYESIKAEVKSIDKKMEEIYSEYVQNAIVEIRNSIANLNFITIPTNHKKIIKAIAETKILPDKLDRALIASINELFKNFKIVEISREQVVNALFKKDQLLTLEQLRKAYFDWENQIKKGNKEDEIRIKLN